MAPPRISETHNQSLDALSVRSSQSSDRHNVDNDSRDNPNPDYDLNRSPSPPFQEEPTGNSLNGSDSRSHVTRNPSGIFNPESLRVVDDISQTLNITRPDAPPNPNPFQPLPPVINRPERPPSRLANFDWQLQDLNPLSFDEGREIAEIRSYIYNRLRNLNKTGTIEGNGMEMQLGKRTIIVFYDDGIAHKAYIPIDSDVIIEFYTGIYRSNSMRIQIGSAFHEFRKLRHSLESVNF